MPYGDQQIQMSPTGLARLQQAAPPQHPAGYISPADQRLINEGIRTGGGYIQINDQVYEDDPVKYIELSDAGKAYLAWRGTDPKLAGIEAEQAQVRSTQRELLARQAGENNLQLLQREMQRGVMSAEEYQKKQAEILQTFNNAKAPSPIDYMSTAVDQSDPTMQETRFKDNIKQTLTHLYGDAFNADMADAVGGMTQRNKDGQLENPFALELVKAKMKERLQGQVTEKEQVKMRLKSLDDQFKTIESPTAEQHYGYTVAKNKILSQAGLPTEELPAMQTEGNGLFGIGKLFGSTHEAPQGVADMFAAQAQQAINTGNQAPAPQKIFGTPNSGPIRVQTNQDVRAEIVKARQAGRTSIQIIGPDGVTRNIPVK